MNNNYPALTGVRAIAAYMVFIHHNDIFKENIFGKLIHDFFTEFHVGVTIFFVLSGFLICNRYFEDENFNFKNYFVKRLARIYPMYFILTTITFIISKFSTNLFSLILRNFCSVFLAKSHRVIYKIAKTNLKVLQLLQLKPQLSKAK